MIPEVKQSRQLQLIKVAVDNRRGSVPSSYRMRIGPSPASRIFPAIATYRGHRGCGCCPLSICLYYLFLYPLCATLEQVRQPLQEPWWWQL